MGIIMSSHFVFFINGLAVATHCFPMDMEPQVSGFIINNKFIKFLRSYNMFKKLFFLLAIAAAMWQPAAAGELTFGWNLVNESGYIWDMEFMPDNNYFILCTSTDIQIRNTETGTLVNSYPIGAGIIEFTPDSTKLIMTPVENDVSVPKIQLRNLSDMSLIRELEIPPGTDTAGYDIKSSGIYFQEIVVDPVRPYIYALRSREGKLTNGKSFHSRKIVIYNYETMEEVETLFVNESVDFVIEKMVISKDGSYLAINSHLESELKVWDLYTRQEIRSYKLCEKSGVPTCTKFSELNTDLIYFSGEFPQVNTIYNGLFTYSIQENKIIDTTFGTGNNRILSGYFTFFDNEKRAIKIYNRTILVLNLINKTVEQRIDQDTIASGPKAWYHKLLYSQVNKALIGFSSEFFSYGRNDLGTITSDPINFDSIIYPNPSNGIVSLINSCQNPVQFYEVLSVNGLILIPNTVITTQQGLISIDISELPSGTYFLRFHCNSSVTTYKIIKEN
jgi:WD40 repeat protein